MGLDNRICTDQCPSQEGDTGIIELQEEDEILAKAMLDYLYTGEYTIPTLQTLGNRECHHDGPEHSSSIESCYLAPFGFAIAMYALGDKYDIAGLRTSSSAHLKDMLDCEDMLSLDAYIDVWESAYQNSHGRDELRELIARHIDGKLIKYVSNMGRMPGFLDFLDRVPELSSVLLKKVLRRFR